MQFKLMEYPLTPLLQILLLLAIIIVTSKGAGALSKKLGQPAVLGELLVGLILGPTLLNLLHLPPFTDHEMLGETVKHMADLGVIFLMFLAGLETDLKEMKRVGVAAFLGATGGVALPFIAGTVLGRYVGGYGWFESVFIGTILTATSVSISAQTLLEMGQLRSKEGTTILGAAVIDDVMGIIVLSVVVALHAAGGGAEHAEPIWWVVTKMVGYFAVAILVGDKLVPKLLRWASRWPGTETGFAMAIVVGLLFAFSAEAVGKVAAITGSYLVGVMIARHGDLGHQVGEKLGILAYGFFVPIFFVSIGLQANALEALRGNGLLVAAIVVASIITKIIGSGLGVKLVRFSWAESLRVGIGMISRGEVALIVAGIGLTQGVITQDVFSIMVIMTLATTLVTPILLRLTFPSQAGAASQEPGHKGH
ncbi:MAG TPA: cation:proton antiporter [Symbiobacteriaceae bacterium]|nr:cation:proton antiporter [Symbiobacteriaceae bacterium]